MDRAAAPVPGELAEVAPPWFAWAVAQAPQSRYAEANGNLLHYLEWNTHDRTKPVLLFVHGLRAHAHWWDFIAPFFIESHRVIALDLSGMGDSGWREKYSATQLARDVTTFIEVLGLERPTVVAHSYGGLCTLRAASSRACRRPHRGALWPRSPS